ncbi:MAG: hypothetical protein ACERKU_09685, partial [Nitrospirota bacterium]
GADPDGGLPPTGSVGISVFENVVLILFSLLILSFFAILHLLSQYRDLCADSYFRCCNRNAFSSAKACCVSGAATSAI